MKQTLLEADRIIGHYSNRIVYPEDIAPTCKCGEYPKYRVGNELFCEGCIGDVAMEVWRDMDEYCEFCGSDEEEEGIRINGDFYCRDCFEKSYGI